MAIAAAPGVTQRKVVHAHQATMEGKVDSKTSIDGKEPAAAENITYVSS